MRTPLRFGALVVAGCLGTLLAASALGSGRAPVRAQDAPSVTFQPSSVTAAAGTTITLKVHIDNASNLAAFQLTLQYDAQVLRRGTISVGDFLSQTGRPVTAFDPVELVPGTVLYQALSGPSDKPGVDGSGTLASVTFAGLGEGLSLVSLPEIVLLDSAGNPTTVAGRTATLRLLPAPTATPAPTPLAVLLPIAYVGRR